MGVGPLNLEVNWHYDFFHGLRALAALSRPARVATGIEVVDWGDAREIVTPNALAMVQ